VKKDTVNLPASVRQRLLNLAVERKEDFGLLLIRYALERLLYRLSVSPYRDSFVLKGALLLQVWTQEAYRPTRDLDLLGCGVSEAGSKKIFAEVCSQKVEADAMTFLADTVRVQRIRNEEEYEGVRVLLEARLGNARIPLQIDVGFGDAIVPAAEDREYPTLLAFPAPQLRTYSKESVVAEKFEAIVKLGIANSRMKDFYDLWVLAKRFRFESVTLAQAIKATFQTRRTALPVSAPLAFTADFYDVPSKQTQWKAFLRRSGLQADSSLRDVNETIAEFVMPIVLGILQKDAETQSWKAGGPWERSRTI
jgi:predicted nucleotidyltransferase component of viral defense system